jgi:uncharacterized alkaline shock family protein YloU
MAQDNTNGTGSLKISEDVLATIASIATKEINGVTGLVTTPTQGFKMLFSKKSNSRGIIMEYIDGEAVLNLFINIKYGVKISDVAEAVQLSVKNAIQNMTGICVSKVNIHVAGLVLDTDNTKSN